jgi:hypothetical protein
MTNGGMKIRDRDYSSGDKEEYGARDIESDYEYVDSSEKTATTTPEPVTPRSAPAGPVPDTQSQASATTSSQKTNGVKRKGKQNKTVYEMIESANEERALKRQLLEREFEWKQMIDAREEARSMADMKHRALERNRDKGLELLNIYKNDKTITLQEYFEESKAVMEKYYFESFKFIE